MIDLNAWNSTTVDAEQPAKKIKRKWRAGSFFGDGPRVRMDREGRAVWKSIVEMHRRVRRISDGEAHVARSLLKRLGSDGRCDPSIETLAADSAESDSTVKRALVKLRDLGLAWWVRRLVRNGWRTEQTSNAYVLSVGRPPEIPVNRCEGHRERETMKKDNLPVQQAGRQEVAAAQAALARRRAAVEDLLRGRRERLEREQREKSRCRHPNIGTSGTRSM